MDLGFCVRQATDFFPQVLNSFKCFVSKTLNMIGDPLEDNLGTPTLVKAQDKMTN